MDGAFFYSFQVIFILCFGAGFLHVGLLLLVTKPRGVLRSSLAHLLVVFGLMCLSGAASLYLDLENRLVDYLVYVLLLAVAPLSERFVFTALQVIRRRRFSSPVWLGTYLLAFLGAGAFGSTIPVQYLYAGGYAWLLLVLGGTVGSIAFQLKTGWQKNRPILLFFLTVALNCVLVVSMGVVQLLPDRTGMFPLWAITILSIEVLIVLVSLNPDHFEALARAVDQRLKYAKSRWETGADEACHRLERHMKSDVPHLRSDLKIADLALELKMVPEQLSELINSRFACNFNQYINQYRVADACQMLTERPDLTVLDVCFESGFNSKSVFNQAFKSVTGLTPREFRRKVRSEPSAEGGANTPPPPLTPSTRSPG